MAKLEQFEVDGKYGYKDENGKVVIKPIYNDGPVCFGTESNHNNKFACVAKGTLWGVINEQGEKIVNFLYDDAKCIQNKIVVAKEGKIGILDENGRVIVNPSYHTIECVAMSKDDSYNGRFGQYGEQCVFDSNAEHTKLFRKKIRYSNYLQFDARESMYDFNRFFILSNNGCSELFSIDSGIIENSRFTAIEPLTNQAFAVKQNDKWGIYRADESKLIIECKFDRIVFEGEQVVLLQKDGLWGAKSLDIIDSKNIIDVPTKFLEIKYLGESTNLFGVKTKHTYRGENVEDYTIVDIKGKVFKEMSKFCELDKQCVIYGSNYDRVLASKNSKYGFISTDGYVTIPFQYDVIDERKDGYLDAKIGNSWGVIDVLGKEVVGIKYSARIPLSFSNIIVKNVSNGRYGVLSEDGSEKVPSVYEHLEIKYGCIFFGYNGTDGGREEGNFFSNVNDAIWGAMDENGRVLIRPKYDCFKYQDGFLLAGRDGEMLHCNNDNYERCSEYSGVYDLYLPNGEMIFGGVSDFFYDNENEFYAFFIGGEWKYVSEYCGDISISDYKFERGTGEWLFLDKNFKSIIKNEKGESVIFEKGVIYDIDTSDIPPEIMIPGNQFNSIIDSNIIVCDNYYNEDDKCYVVYAAINIKTGYMSDFYPYLKYAGNSLFFFANEGDFIINNYGDGLGILTAEKIIKPAEYLFFTVPVNGFFFGAIKNDDGYHSLLLFSLTDENIVMTAIEKMKTEDLIDYAIRGSFKIKFDDNEKNINNIILPKREIFDKSFIKYVSKKESNYSCFPFKDIYWYSTDYIMSKENYYADCEDDDGMNNDIDWDEERWYYLTDGMYGDYPGGDVDYDILGFD